MDGRNGDSHSPARALRYTPIIFISAIDTLESDVFRGVASGAVDYLFKPVVLRFCRPKFRFVDLFQMNERLKQQAVRQSEERFRLIVESLQDYAVFMMNPKAGTLWNREPSRCGMGTERGLGPAFARLYSPRIRPPTNLITLCRRP
jgi:DNA-binding response OmpR family regulator